MNNIFSQATFDLSLFSGSGTNGVFLQGQTAQLALNATGNGFPANGFVLQAQTTTTASTLQGAITLFGSLTTSTTGGGTGFISTTGSLASTFASSILSVTNNNATDPATGATFYAPSIPTTKSFGIMIGQASSLNNSFYTYFTYSGAGSAANTFNIAGSGQAAGFTMTATGATTFSGNATFSNPVSCSNSLSVTGALSTSSTLLVSSNAQVNGNFTLSGSSTFRRIQSATTSTVFSAVNFKSVPITFNSTFTNVPSVSVTTTYGATNGALCTSTSAVTTSGFTAFIATASGGAISGTVGFGWIATDLT
jgi:hypothetical protein